MQELCHLACWNWLHSFHSPLRTRNKKKWETSLEMVIVTTATHFYLAKVQREQYALQVQDTLWKVEPKGPFTHETSS